MSSLPAEMHCDEFVELVTAYLDGALDAVQRDRMMAHLALCDGCSRYLEQIAVTVETLGDAQPEAVNPELRAALIAAFRDRAGKESGPA